MTEDRKHRVATYRAAWRALNKAHTLLMAEPTTQPLAKNVFDTMVKLDGTIERASFR